MQQELFISHLWSHCLCSQVWSWGLWWSHRGWSGWEGGGWWCCWGLNMGCQCWAMLCCWSVSSRGWYPGWSQRTGENRKGKKCKGTPGMCATNQTCWWTMWSTFFKLSAGEMFTFLQHEQQQRKQKINFLTLFGRIEKSVNNDLIYVCFQLDPDHIKAMQRSSVTNKQAYHIWAWQKTWRA